MTRIILAASAALVLAACSQEPATPADDATANTSPGTAATALPETAASATAATPAPERSMPPTDAGRTFPTGAWETVSSGEGDGLFFGVVEGDPARVHLFCPSGGGGLLVNVNAFRPVGSEERMTLGSGDTLATLVADPAGDPDRGGVSGVWSGGGPVPADFATILTGPAGLSVSYGAQSVGPLPPVPADTTRTFLAGCTD